MWISHCETHLKSVLKKKKNREKIEKNVVKKMIIVAAHSCGMKFDSSHAINMSWELNVKQIEKFIISFWILVFYVKYIEYRETSTKEGHKNPFSMRSPRRFKSKSIFHNPYRLLFDLMSIRPNAEYKNVNEILNSQPK